jgi:polyphosphate kinase
MQNEKNKPDKKAGHTIQSKSINLSEKLPDTLPENQKISPEGVVCVNLGRDPLKKKISKNHLENKHPDFYLNREFTWLNFNRRVLSEAENDKIPLLERVKFLAISASTLDEFIMKRVGGLKLIEETSPHDISIDGRTAKEQLNVSTSIIHKIKEDQYCIYLKLLKLLKKNNIDIVEYKSLLDTEKEFLKNTYIKNIMPLITPQGIDQAHPFPFISNLSLNLLVSIKHPHGQTTWARVKVPMGNELGRFLKIENSNKLIRIEDVIRNHLDLLFPSINIIACDLFRVTRNANTEKDEEKADDLLELIETEIQDRKFAPIVRLQVEKNANKKNIEFLRQELEISSSHDIQQTRGMIGLADLFEIASWNIPGLRFKPHHPIDPPRLKKAESIMDNIRNEGPVLVFHPYESFEGSVERFLREASEDPSVRAIKMTLYRTSKKSEIISYLLNAVENGKQVAVVIELKARFDEKANIEWANQLEEAGIHVTYGVIGLKTHAKMILVVRKDPDQIRIYSHVGTGNYHAGNARSYTDLGLFTCDDIINNDLRELFNFLTTGLTPHRSYQKILMAPGNFKKSILKLIQREMDLHTKKNPGLIRMKMNALEDPDIVDALYEASQKGVTIDLIVRDSCRLRPGIPGLSENIKIRSITGRFLEHFRLYYFKGANQHDYFLGSADLMRRSLLKRVELLVPVTDPVLKNELSSIFEIQLSEKYTHWIMGGDGSCEKINGTEGSGDSQEVFIEIAIQRTKAADKIKRILSSGKSKKEGWAGY